MDIQFKKIQLSTTGILVSRALNREIDEHWIDWSVSMLEQGCDTKYLRVLAGESPPYNQFELTKLVDRTFKELELDWSDTEHVVKEYAVELIGEMLEGKRQSQTVLRILKDICIELDYVEYFYEFYLLYFAQADLQHSEVQWYWPEANRTNIEYTIIDFTKKWIEQHSK